MCHYGLFLNGLPGSGVLCYSVWLVCFIISLGEMISLRSIEGVNYASLRIIKTIYIYSATAASLLQMRTDVRCGEVGKGYSADVQLA